MTGNIPLKIRRYRGSKLSWERRRTTRQVCPLLLYYRSDVLFTTRVARLPRSASWAKPSHDRAPTITSSNNNLSTAPGAIGASAVRSTRRGDKGTRPRPVTPSTPEIPEALPTFWKTRDVKGVSAKASSVASSSRPSTPANSKPSRQKQASPSIPVPPRSPTSSVTVESDPGSGSQGAPSLSPAPSTPAIPPGLPAVPPGLAAPPGLPHPGGRGPPGVTSYQMSSQVQALLNDVKARRESTLPSIGASPFPDFDRTLQNLTEVDGKFGGFSFNLDPKLAETEVEDDAPQFPEATSPFHGSFMDAFPALRASSHPPGVHFSHPQRPIYDPHNSPAPSQSSPAPSYTGSFNPFAEGSESDSTAATRRPALGDDSRKMSRFGFARNTRQNGNLSSTSSPLISPTPLSPSESVSLGQQHLFGGGSVEIGSPSQWSAYQHHPHTIHSHNVSAASSPLVPQAQAQIQGSMYQQHLPSTSRFQPFDHGTGVSEAALREFIQNSREQQQQQRANAARNAALVGRRPLLA
jgi:CCR4-NOT transcription complex subunit 4